MQSYYHFTLEERQKLHDRLAEGRSLRSIAKEMGRDVSSISRELARNKNKDGSYNAWRGCTLYLVRRKSSRRKYRIETDAELNHWIAECLSDFWPPETIVSIWKRKKRDAKLSHCTIYSAIKAGRLQGFSPLAHLRRHGQRTKNHNTATIHPEHFIKDRPEVINSRERVGDWEGDTVHGAIGRGGLVSCVDRKSRYLAASLIRNFTSAVTNKAMETALQGLPVCSITLDNGSEFAGFKEFETSLQTTVYFADPHSPWQRGTNENTNDILRFFFPKGMNFHAVTQEALDHVVSLINNRPRKCLGWLSPLEILSSKCCT